ncbi:MAG TPA: BrnT family toxin [Desulfovibrio sp.]|jgi:uncharacterized DUF497 family protein|uniref:BrnT family toxin n=1 Tax=Desulfovibrio TaxID=872 RepID=UPI002BA96566|nr:BrnT family toxin [Desulfovibrio sp.]HMM38903.1 BrnT family toxin [Desulfovibrio sp.]
MRIEWDEAKNEANQRKHDGIGFDLAAEVFDDPLHKSIPERVVDGEQRWQTLGMVRGLLLLLVAHTYRDQGGEEVIRIISARRATRRERQAYEG